MTVCDVCLEQTSSDELFAYGESLLCSDCANDADAAVSNLQESETLEPENAAGGTL